MSSNPSTQQRGVKRKKPPTFQHHPAERAKKLKRLWVETQKVKSKWKTQKRREGLVATRGQPESMADKDGKEVRDSDEDQDEDSISGSPAASEESEEAVSEGCSVDAPQRTTASSIEVKPPQKGGQRKVDEQLPLRDLQKAAYSRSSLHTHTRKSAPFHRGGRGTASRGGSVGRGRDERRSRGRGRGQPNMGLRMKAMLERIERDHR